MLVRFKTVGWDVDEYEDWLDVPEESDFSDVGEFLIRADDFRSAETDSYANIASISYFEWNEIRRVVVRASMNEISEKISQALARR